MATRMPIKVSTNELVQFESVTTDIVNIFERLIGQLIARRDALLREIQDKKENYIEKETSRKAALEEMTKQIDLLSFRVNENQDLQQQTADLYKQRIKDLETPTNLPQPFFSCPQLSLIQNQIAQFGELKEWKLDYSLKKRPVLAVGKRGKANDELYEAKGLALDEPNQLIYIADSSNCRIQVVSLAGKFLKRFGQEILKSPFGISVTDTDVFVTDIQLHALLQFSKKDCKLVTKTGTTGGGGGEGELNFPSGLCTNNDGDVFVAERDNNRVSVFSKDLKFLKHLGTLQLKNPRDVKVTQSRVVVLDANNIHFYSRIGDYLHTCVTQGWNEPLFFCLDTGGNILISDCQRHNIKILSPSGQFIHTIGKRGHERGELYYPFGICLSQTGTTFVISWNNNFGLQSF